MADATPSENLSRADIPGTPIDIASTPEKQYDEASGLGRKLLKLTTDRRDRRLSTFAPRPDRFSQEHIAAIGKKEPGAITEEDIRLARLGSFGLTLEVARQVVSGDVDSNPGKVIEELDNLRGFVQVFRAGAELGNALVVEDFTGFADTTRGVLSRELRKPAEEITMDDEHLKGWVTDMYKKAEEATARRFRAVSAVLDRR